MGLSRHGMRQQVGRIYLTAGYVVEQARGILLGMLLAHLQGKVLFHNGAHGKLINEAPYTPTMETVPPLHQAIIVSRLLKRTYRISPTQGGLTGHPGSLHNPFVSPSKT